MSPETVVRPAVARRAWLALVVIAAVACDRTPQPAGAAPTVVDSILPTEVALGRFRKDLPEPAGLTGGAGNRDTLVRRVIDALRTSDTLAFKRLAVSRAEWAWLYYPTNVLARPPYELPPALAWFHLQETNRKGVFRALRQFGGKPLQYQGYRCAPEPVVEGENRIWTGCVVTLAVGGERPADVRLFSSILERGGRVAILSYHNDF